MNLGFWNGIKTKSSIGLWGGGEGVPPSFINTVFSLDAGDFSTLFQDDAGSTPVTANDDPVGRANSDGTSNATQATETKRPLAKTDIINGKSVIKGDYSDDTLVTASIAHGIGTGDFYAIMVVRTIAVGRNYNGIFKIGTFEVNLYQAEFFIDTIDSFPPADPALSYNTNYILEIARVGGTLTKRINGTQSNQYANSTSIANGVIQVCGNTSHAASDVNIGAIRIIKGTLSETEQAQVRDYYNNIWSVF